MTVVLSTKESLSAYKLILVGNIPSLKLAVVPTNQGRTVHIQGYWDPDRSVAAVTAMGIPVD